VFGEDGTEYKEWNIEFSCRFHRTQRNKKLDSNALSDNDRIRKAASELTVVKLARCNIIEPTSFLAWSLGLKERGDVTSRSTSERVCETYCNLILIETGYQFSGE
jgi:hypothetical protein